MEKECFSESSVSTYFKLHDAKTTTEEYLPRNLKNYNFINAENNFMKFKL